MSTAISVEDLVKRYKGSRVNAVDGITFDVQPGEFFALLGVNGAGKSTTINMLCTLLEKTSGKAFVNGYESGIQDSDIRQSIGVVFQTSVLDDMLTARENLTCRSSFYGIAEGVVADRIIDLADRLDMRNFLDKPYGKLSGGQRRKCDIARSLIQHPRLLFLDEPTTGLDPQSRIDLWNTIQEIRATSDMAIVLTTHYMEEANSADRVAIIDQGKIVAIDTPQNLKERFSKDTLTLYVEQQQMPTVEAMLEREQRAWTREGDRYRVTYARAEDTGFDVIALLSQLKPYIRSFEVRQGDMDNVFLNVVGRRLGHE